MADPNSLLSALGADLAYFDDSANRAKINNANRLKEIAAMGLQRKKSLADSLASTGMAHSSVALDAQTDLGSTMDSLRTEANNSLNDTLANIARQKIQQEQGFRINSLLPR